MYEMFGLLVNWVGLTARFYLVYCKEVSDFQYHGAWISNSKKYMGVRIAKAWSVSNKMDNIWKSNLSREIKVTFYRATIESVLMYGSETWTLKKTLENRINGAYTRLLRAPLNISWREHKTNMELYGELKPITSTLVNGY